MKTTKFLLLLAGTILISGTAPAQYYLKSTLTSGIGPKYFAYNSDSGKVYVSNTGESTIGIMKNYTYQPCTLGFGPSEMQYSPLAGKLYVGMGFGSVYILNGNDDQLDTALTVSTMGVQLTYNSLVNKLYVSSSGYGLYIYNGSTYSLLNFFTGFEGNLYYFPGQQTYVAHGYDSLIGVIDGAGDGIIDTIGFSGITSASEMVGSPEMQKLYVALPTYNQVGIVDASTNSLITKVSVGANPIALAYSPDHKKTYVACLGDNNLWLIDSMNVASSIFVGDSVNAIIYNPMSRHICFSDKNNSQLKILDPEGDYVLQTINLPTINPAGLIADPANGDVYAALTGVGGPGTIAVTGYDSLAPIGATLYNAPPIINTDTLTVFWSPGTDQGGSGIESYELYIQPDSSEPYANIYYPPDTSALLFLFNDSTMYHLMVVAKDSAGNPINIVYDWQDSVYVDFSYVPDTTPPSITATDPAAGDSLISPDAQVLIYFSEPVDTSSLRFHCTPDPGGWSHLWGFNHDYLELSHNKFAPGTSYSFSVDSLNDPAGNQFLPGPAPNPWSFTTKPSVVLSTAWQGGAYRLFSIPLQGTDSSATALLGDDLGTYGSSNWRLVGYKPEVDSFVERPFVTNGHGYWLASVKNATLDISGVEYDSSVSVKLALYPGWNLIGDPFNNKISVGSIQVIDTAGWWSYSDPMSWSLVDPRIWYYTDNTADLVNNGRWDTLSPLDTASYLLPWRGYALNAASPCSLYIQTLIDKSRSKQSDYKSEEYDIDWQLEISAVCGLATDGGLRVGVSPQAGEKYDRLDAAKPPLVSDQIKLYLPHDDWGRGPCRQYLYDFRPSGEYIEWPLVVENTEAGNAELSFQLEGALSPGYKLYLINRADNSSTAITDNSRVGFTGSQTYAVIYTDRDISSLNFKPLSFFVNKPAPNPFSRILTVSYQIPEAMPVKIVVYNISGQRIKNLADDWLSPGYYKTTWDGRDDAGRNISTGIYFVRILAGNNAMTQKVIKIK